MDVLRKTRHELQRDLEAAVHDAFDRYGPSCLWWMRRPNDIVPGTARTMAYSLRREGPAAARQTIERLEDLADAIEPPAEETPGHYRGAA